MTIIEFKFQTRMKDKRLTTHTVTFNWIHEPSMDELRKLVEFEQMINANSNTRLHVSARNGVSK